MTFEQGALVVIATLGGVVTFLFWLYVNSLKDRIARNEADLASIKSRFDKLQEDHQEVESTLAERTADLRAAKEKLHDLRTVLEGCSVDYCPMRPRLQAPHA